MSLIYISLYSVIVVVVPLLFLSYYSIHASLSKLLIEVLSSAIKQSFLQATVSTGISLGLGLLFGILLIVYNGRMKGVIISILLVTYVLPGLIMALGIISIFGFSSRFWEIVYGNVIYNSPMIAVLAFSTGNATSIREVYSAKILGASDSQVVSKFYLPNSMRGGLLGGILTFILSFEGFSLPLIIGGPSYSTVEVMIYEFKNVFPSFGQFPFSTASLLGLLQLGILIVPLYAYLSVRSNSRRNDSNLPLPLRRYNGIALAGLLIFVVFVLTPLFEMFLRFPLWQISLAEVTRRLQISIPMLLTNTILFSFVSTFFALLISIAVTVYRSSFRNQFVVLLPIIFSPVTLALSYFLVFGEYVPTGILIVLIFTVTVVPLNLRMMIQSIDTIPVSETNSSKSMGDSAFSTFFRVQLPRIKREVSTILALMFITVMGEFSSIITVYTASTETITVGIYKLLLLRDLRDTYYLTEIFLIVIFVSSFVINQIGKGGAAGQT